jgi:alpha-tubulin suppressor-like RCC1 family protein
MSTATVRLSRLANRLVSLLLAASLTVIHAEGSAQDLSFWQVAAGHEFTVAIATDGTLWAWGRNSNGVLGDGTTVDRPEPVRISADQDWKQVAAGELHTIALKTDGTLWSWGANWLGQLGDGTDEGEGRVYPARQF